MVFEVIPFAVCTAATGALGAGGWHIAMGNKGDSWSTCGGRGKGYSMKPERSTEEIAQALYATDGTKNENIGAERAHTGLSPRLSHVFETMAGTQNRNPKPPPLPPPKQHRNTPFKPEVDEKGKRVVSVAEGLRMAFRHDNIGPPQGHVPYAQPEPVAETTYDRYTRGRSSPIVERRSLSPSRPNTNSRRFSPDPTYGRRVSPGRRLSPDPGYGRRLSPSGRVERVAVQYAAPEAPPQPAWIQRVEVARDPPRDPRLQSLQQGGARPSSVPQLSVSYFTPPAPKPLMNLFANQDDPPVPANASSHIFPTSNPRPRFPDSLPNPALSPSSTYSSTAVSPNATRLSDSRDDRSYPSPTARAALALPQQEYRPMSAPVAAGPSPSSAGIGISLVPDQQGNLRIASMVPGGAAMRSGKLSVGDILTTVNQVEVRGKSVPEAIRLILGPHGTLVHLGVKGSVASAAVRSVAIVRTASSYASAPSAAPNPSPDAPSVQPPAFTPSARAPPAGSFQGTRAL